MAMFRDRAAKTPAGEWLLFTGFDNLLQGGDLTMADLDAASKDHPILVYYINMHTAAGNGLAFARARIPADIGDLPGGGRFGRDAARKLDGMIYEELALKKFAVAIPKITPELAGKAVIDWLKINASHGNTLVHEAGVLVFGDLLEGYERVAASSPCRASISLMYDSMNEAEPYKQFGHGAQATTILGTTLTIYAMKIVGDGSNQTKSAAQTIPYLNGKDTGRPNFDARQLAAMVGEVKAQGWPVSIHCNGDETLDLALDAIENAYGGLPRDRRQPDRALHDHPARADRADGPARRPAELSHEPCLFLRRGLPRPVVRPRAGGADGPGGGLRAPRPAVHDPHRRAVLEHRHAAAGPDCGNPQISVDGSIVGPEQAVSLTDALRAVTSHAAGQVGLGDQLGTLETGKLADFTILEKDPYAVDPDALMAINVSQTWVGGRKMFG